MLSEEEAIKEIEDYLDYEGSVSIQAIATLYTSYNKEKEKNKLLIDGKFREVADKNSYIKDNYISKDKIKELREIDNIDLIQFKIRELLEERN